MYIIHIPNTYFLGFICLVLFVCFQCNDSQSWLHAGVLWGLDKMLMSQPLRGSSLVAWADGLDIESFKFFWGFCHRCV